MNDLVIQKLDERLKYRIFQMKSCNGKKHLDFDDELNSIIVYLSDREYSYYVFNVDYKNVRNLNKHFFDYYLPLQNVYINHDMLGIYNGSPFDIKTDTSSQFDCLGRINHHNEPDRVVFDSIILDKNLGSKMVSIYAHELVHSQIDKNVYKILDNYFDNEFLSIFVELVISYHLNSMFNNNTLENRLEMLNNELEYYKNHKDDLETRCYIESTFKAFHLYYDYINSNNLIKKEILNSIEDVFKEKINVGRFSYIYEIDYDNSKDVKYLKR